MEGYIHSLETFGTKDGPGIRFVVFMQGCPLRCLYCHNPDTWLKGKAKSRMTAAEVFQEYQKVKGFVKGGITLSGGEPLMQPDFVLEFLQLCRKEGVHTAIDTSGYIFNEKIKEVLKWVDLVLLDIKHFDAIKYEKLTGKDLAPTLEFAAYLNNEDIATWIRYVLLPGYTDDKADIAAMADYLSRFNNIKQVDVLPFHQLGASKWEELGLTYKLKEALPPTDETRKEMESLFRQRGFYIKER